MKPTPQTTPAPTKNLMVVVTAYGDVLAMRPLLSHASGSSHEGTRLHRRILHLEFAATQELPDGVEWHDFIKPTASIGLTECAIGNSDLLEKGLGNTAPTGGFVDSQIVKK